MNNKQAKRARAIAYREASRRNLWKQGADQLKANWKDRIKAWLSKSFRERNADMVGRWYRRTIKKWSKQVAASYHDRDFAAFEAARRRMAKVKR